MSGNRLRKLQVALLNSPWEYMYSLKNVDDMVSYFENIFFNLLNHFCPVTTKKVPIKGRLSFFTPALFSERELTKDLLHKAKLSGSVIEYNQYLQKKKVYKSNCRITRSSMYQQQYDKLIHEPLKLWHVIKDVTGLDKKKKGGSRIAIHNDHGEYINSNLDIANTFCNYFRDVVLDVVSTIPTTNDNFDLFDKPRRCNSFYMCELEPPQVANLLEHLKCRRSYDDNFVSNMILKKLAIPIALPLTIIFNHSFHTGKYPTQWKNVQFTPVFKNKGNRFDKTKYRPISVINIFGKSLEQAAFLAMYKYVEKYNLLSDYQFGYRRGKSIHQSIISQLNFISKGVNNNDYVCQFLLDNKLAYDTVDRSLLLKRLYHIGFRGTFADWLKSYLNDRTVRVRVNGVQSTCEFTPQFGILQGSAISCLLFVLYIDPTLYICNKVNNDIHLTLKPPTVSDTVQPCYISENTEEKQCLSSHYSMVAHSVTFHSTSHVPTMYSSMKTHIVQLLFEKPAPTYQEYTFRKLNFLPSRKNPRLLSSNTANTAVPQSADVLFYSMVAHQPHFDTNKTFMKLHNFSPGTSRQPATAAPPPLRPKQ